MGVWEQNPARGRCNIDGAASSTAFPSVSFARWVCQGGAIGWANAATACVLSLYEIDDATSSAAFFVFRTTATSGFYSFFLGDNGVQASSTYASRMVFNASGTTGTFTGMFSGYYVGM